MSSGRQRYIVNSGIDRFGRRNFVLWAARRLHTPPPPSTIVLVPFQPQCEPFQHDRHADHCRPHRVQRDRIEEMGRQGFVASHDGYARLFGIYHERRIVLSHNGSVIQGADRFYRGDGRPSKANGRDNIAVRFHLHRRSIFL
nr:heparinase II/III family protein [Brucella suis]